MSLPDVVVLFIPPWTYLPKATQKKENRFGYVFRALNSVVGDASTNSENKNGVAEAVAPVPLIQLMRAIGSVKERGMVKVSVVLPFTPGHPPWSTANIEIINGDSIVCLNSM